MRETSEALVGVSSCHFVRGHFPSYPPIYTLIHVSHRAYQESGRSHKHWWAGDIREKSIYAAGNCFFELMTGNLGGLRWLGAVFPALSSTFPRTSQCAVTGCTWCQTQS